MTVCSEWLEFISSTLQSNHSLKLVTQRAILHIWQSQVLVSSTHGSLNILYFYHGEVLLLQVEINRQKRFFLSPQISVPRINRPHNRELPNVSLEAILLRLSLSYNLEKGEN